MVANCLLDLQEGLIDRLESFEDGARFERVVLPGERGGEARPCVLEDGAVLERVAVSFTRSHSSRAPSALLERRPELEDRGYAAASLSVIVHPRNPYAPASHLNLRFFEIEGPEGEWWFAGGCDLTPTYGFIEDAVEWHRALDHACRPFGSEVYREYKRACDRYYWLPHRNETRGVGGLFFDRLTEGGFERCMGLARSIGAAYATTYPLLLERRSRHPFGDRERRFQLYRRGRYVEFNLLYDRGTRYGLEAGVRADSVLGSLPPLVAWGRDPSRDGLEDAGAEADLARFLVARDWLEDVG
jgi:coproporphyrinogen III oxidase